MRHRKHKTTFGRKRDQRKALLRGLCVSLIEKEQITTTAAKGRAVRRLVEKAITAGQDKSVHRLRTLEAQLGSKAAAKKIVDTLSPRFKKRPGGYTRMTKLGVRSGDGAKQVVVEIISE